MNSQERIKFEVNVFGKLMRKYGELSDERNRRQGKTEDELLIHELERRSFLKDSVDGVIDRIGRDSGEEIVELIDGHNQSVFEDILNLESDSPQKVQRDVWEGMSREPIDWPY